MADGECHLYDKNYKDTKLFKILPSGKYCGKYFGGKGQEPAINVCPVVCEGVQGNKRKGWVDQERYCSIRFQQEA